MQPLIKSYSFGKIIVDDKTFSHDIIILPDKIIDNWWRKEGHNLQLDDLKDVEDVIVDAVVIGTGYYGLMRVDKEVIEYFKQKGMEIYVYKTREAVEKYNELVRKGKKVIGLFHLTC